MMADTGDDSDSESVPAPAAQPRPLKEKYQPMDENGVDDDRAEVAGVIERGERVEGDDGNAGEIVEEDGADDDKAHVAGVARGEDAEEDEKKDREDVDADLTKGARGGVAPGKLMGHDNILDREEEDVDKVNMAAAGVARVNPVDDDDAESQDDVDEREVGKAVSAPDGAMDDDQTQGQDDVVEREAGNAGSVPAEAMEDDQTQRQDDVDEREADKAGSVPEEAMDDDDMSTVTEAGEDNMDGGRTKFGPGNSVEDKVVVEEDFDVGERDGGRADVSGKQTHGDDVLEEDKLDAGMDNGKAEVRQEEMMGDDAILGRADSDADKVDGDDRAAAATGERIPGTDETLEGDASDADNTENDRAGVVRGKLMNNNDAMVVEDADADKTDGGRTGVARGKMMGDDEMMGKDEADDDSTGSISAKTGRLTEKGMHGDVRPAKATEERDIQRTRRPKGKKTAERQGLSQFENRTGDHNRRHGRLDGKKAVARSIGDSTLDDDLIRWHGNEQTQPEIMEERAPNQADKQWPLKKGDITYDQSTGLGRESRPVKTRVSNQRMKSRVKNSNTDVKKAHRLSDIAYLKPAGRNHQKPVPQAQCLANVLDQESSGQSRRDFFAHPVLLIGGDDRWPEMTNVECDVPCYHVNDDQIFHKRADGWVSITYVGELNQPPNLQCYEQHVIKGTMESRAYFPQLYGQRTYRHGVDDQLDVLKPAELSKSLRRADFPYHDLTWTANVRLDSAITLGYGPGRLVDPNIPIDLSSKTYDVVAIISNCNDKHAKSRIAFVNDLIRSTPDLALEFYGECGSLGRYKGAKEDLIKKAKFTLVFENSAETDYVTEKFFLPLSLGSVAVVYGAPNIHDYEPGPGSIIDAMAYVDEPAKLGHLLLIAARNEEEYKKYHAWRQDGYSDPYKAYIETQVRERNTFYFHRIPMPQPATYSELEGLVTKALADAGTGELRRIYSMYSAYALQEAAQKDPSIWINTDKKVAALEPGFKLEVILL